MRICQWDREVLGLWEQNGIPDDQSTHEAALRMLWRLWEGYQELERLIQQLNADGPLCLNERHEGLENESRLAYDLGTWAAAERDHYQAALREIAVSDYRGNMPWEQVAARKALRNATGGNW